MATADKSIVGVILGIILSPITVLFRFFSDWVATRNWRWLAVSVPALLVGGLVTVGFAQSYFGKRGTLAGSYAKQALRSFKAEDYPRAEMLYRKASRYRPDDPQLKFSRGFVLAKMDRLEDAYAVMKSAAPLEEDAESSYDLAHIWIARQLLSQQLKVEGNALILAEAHLDAILRKTPTHIEANRIKADIALSTRNGDAAIKHMVHIVDQYPDTRIVYARLLDAAEKKEDARSEARKAYEYYRVRIPKQLADGKKPPVKDWLNWASSCMILDQFNQATKLLIDAQKHCENTKMLRQGLAGVFVRWTQRLDEVDEPNISQQLELLGQALRLAPDNPAVLERVALLLGRGDQTDELAEEMLQDALTEGTAPAIVHFLLGTRAAANGDDKKAKSHLEQARIQNPNTPVVLNNLAWVLAGRGPKELDTALEYANQAVKLQPYQANFRDTRGQIHIRLGNWREGIADLEEALRNMKNNAQIHLSLAKGYENIGQPEIAAKHTQLAEKIKASIDKPKSKPEALGPESESGSAGA